MAHEHPKDIRCSQDVSPHDFICRLRALFVSSTAGQEDAAVDPTAFDWCALGRKVRDWHGIALLHSPAGFSARKSPSQSSCQKLTVGRCMHARALIGYGAATLVQVSFLFRPAPVVTHMLGPLDAKPKPPKAKAAQRQKRKAPEGDPKQC